MSGAEIVELNGGYQGLGCGGNGELLVKRYEVPFRR